MLNASVGINGLSDLSTCSSILICFCKQQLCLAKINHVINFSQLQLLFAKTNEDRTTSRKAPLEYIHKIGAQAETRTETLQPVAILPSELAMQIAFLPGVLWGNIE